MWTTKIIFPSRLPTLFLFMSSPKSIIISSALADIVITKARETKQKGHYTVNVKVQEKNVSVQLWLLSNKKARAYSPSGKPALKQALLDIVWSASVEEQEQQSSQKSDSPPPPIPSAPNHDKPPPKQSTKNTDICIQVKVKVNKSD